MALCGVPLKKGCSVARRDSDASFSCGSLPVKNSFLRARGAMAFSEHRAVTVSGVGASEVGG